MFKGMKVWEYMTGEGMNTGGRDRSTKSKGNLQICSSDHCFCVMWVLRSTRCGNHCTGESFLCIHNACKSSLVAQTVRNLPECRKPGFDSWIRKIPGGGNPLQYSCLEKSMDRGAWQATVHGVAESDTTEWLIHTHAMHGSILET